MASGTYRISPVSADRLQGGKGRGGEGLSDAHLDLPRRACSSGMYMQCTRRCGAKEGGPVRRLSCRRHTSLSLPPPPCPYTFSPCSLCSTRPGPSKETCLLRRRARLSGPHRLGRWARLSPAWYHRCIASAAGEYRKAVEWTTARPARSDDR